MKRLNTEEIKQMADALCMTEQEAKEVADIFADIYEKEQSGKRGWKIGMPLDSADDYIREWENHWHREMNWQEFYDYEKECCYYDYDEAETIFETTETFKEYVKMFDFAYELSNGLIIIVC
jgi:hypothetical protein